MQAKHKKTRSLTTFDSKESNHDEDQRKNSNEQKLYEAIQKNNVSKIMDLLQKEVDIDWQNPEDNLKTPLHVAIESGNSISVALVLGKGAKIHLRDSKGRAALNVAIQSNNKEVLNLLANRTVSSLEQELLKDHSGKVLQNGNHSHLQNGSPSHQNGNHSKSSYLDANDKKRLQDVTTNSAFFHPTSLFRTHFARQSLISEMLQISHFQTIYNIFVAIFCIAFTNILLSNYMEKGVFLEFDLFFWCFGQFGNAALIWLALFCLSFTAYFLQEIIVRKALSPRFAYAIHALTILAMYSFLPWYVVMRAYPPATAFAISAEMVRLTMKMHSYLMVNMQLRHAKERKSTDESVKEYPGNVSLGDYWMFLWFPTLIYQPSYPRTESVRISFVIKRFGDSFLCILFTYAIFVRYCIPHFSEFVGNYTNLVMGVFHVMIPGIAVNLLGFYGILHSWLNAFAELTRFADRHFYSDWWNSTGWGTYYRKWNAVVHNFLHRHLFMDAVETYGAGKHTALWLTFIISAIVHEYIIAIGLGFYKPILLIMFVVPGVLFIYLTKFFKGNRMWNIFMWAMLIVGHGMLVGLYSRAWYFTYHSPRTEFHFLDYIWIV